MADEAYPPQPTSHILRGIDWREVFPFTHLFRAFRVAVHPSKLLLALVALILIYTGGRVLDGLWSRSYWVPAEFRHAVVAERTFRTGEPDRTHFGVFDTFFAWEIQNAQGAAQSFLGVSTAANLNPRGSPDWGTGFGYMWMFFVLTPGWLWANHWLFALLFSAWFLLVWSVFGGAICRIAAVHVARDEKMSVRQAVRFSVNKVLSFAFAPLIPLLIALAIGVVLSLAGLVLFHVGYVGPVLAGVLFILALLGGLVMTLVVVGLLGGLNLMYPTIAVEGSDSFDAISRSFSYVFARPWRMLWYTIVSLVYGAVCYLFVRFFIYLILVLTWFFVGWWLTGWSNAQYKAMFPQPQFSEFSYRFATGLRWDWAFAGWAISFWNYLLISLLGAFAISFYLSISTITYYLMRREVDATDLEDVYVEDAEDELADTLPPGGPAAVTASPTTIVVTAPATPAEGTSAAPGGGVTDTAGSGSGETQSYTPPGTDNPGGGAT